MFPSVMHDNPCNLDQPSRAVRANPNTNGGGRAARETNQPSTKLLHYSLLLAVTLSREPPPPYCCCLYVTEEQYIYNTEHMQLDPPKTQAGAHASDHS